MSELKRLNLGCGDMIIPGFINCDLYDEHADVKCDVINLPFEDNSIDEIYASHIIEHFDFQQAFDVLKEWKRVLKTDGVLTVETPDLLGSCKKFVESDEQTRVNMYGHFFARPWVAGQIHKFLYTPTQLRWTLSQAGFIDIKQTPALRYIGCEDINLKMSCKKAQ